MLIHSTKMETVVFIQDTHLPQKSSTTSKDYLESRGLQSRTMRPMLGLISVLVLLVVGMVGLCVWMYLYPFAEKINKATSPAADSTTHCEWVNMNFTMSEQKGSIFKVPRDGTYLIYGRVKREHKKTDKKCEDMIRLCGTNTQECIKRNFTSNSFEIENIAFAVQLESPGTEALWTMAGERDFKHLSEKCKRHENSHSRLDNAVKPSVFGETWHCSTATGLLLEGTMKRLDQDHNGRSGF
ncbi:hypothetical protein AOLI_G00030620 [Acnodon oligacanthus]